MEKIKTKIIQIGNSKGIRIPKHVLERLNFHNQIELIIDVDKQQIHIKSMKSVRQDWEKAFEKMHQLEKDELLIEDGLDIDSDSESWEW
ncbi:MAG: AbrB/MazE/SpoVT family DNA-binding domain-containing protein [Promethearchaeota archaeon]